MNENEINNINQKIDIIIEKNKLLENQNEKFKERLLKAETFIKNFDNQLNFLRTEYTKIINELKENYNSKLDYIFKKIFQNEEKNKEKNEIIIEGKDEIKINQEQNKIKNFLDIEKAKELIEKSVNEKFIEYQKIIPDLISEITKPKKEIKIDKKKEKKISDNLKKFEDEINNIYKDQSQKIPKNLLYDLKKVTKALLIQSEDPLSTGEKILKNLSNNIKIDDDNREYYSIKKSNIINEIDYISKEIYAANDDEFKKKFIDKYGITEKDIKDKILDKYIKKYNRNENKIIEEILKKLKYI